MADVTIKILSKVETTAVRSIASPLSAAEAKGGVLGENAMWTGTLTADNSLTVLVGQQQLVAGNVYHLTLQEQAGKQKLLGMCCAVEFLPSLHGHLHSMFVHLRPKPGCHHRCEFESSNKSIAGASTQERHSLRLNSSEHAHASSSGHEMASFVQDGLNPESVARQAASGFLIGSIQSLHAVGTSGPVFKARSPSEQQMVLKVASLDSNKHQNLKHQRGCFMALRSLWGQCVPHVLLAGVLSSHGHGYGLGTALLQGRHPLPGNMVLLPLAEEALRQVHKCDIMVNDLHPDNVVLVADGTMTKVFFVEFSHSIPSPSLAQFEEDMYNLRAMFSRKINLNRSDSMMKKTLCA